MARKPKVYVVLTCTQCEKSFERYAVEHAYKQRQFGDDCNTFCSKECKGKFDSEKGRVDISCDHCGKMHSKLKSVANNGSKHFCSAECQHAEFAERAGDVCPKNTTKTIPCYRCQKPCQAPGNVQKKLCDECAALPRHDKIPFKVKRCKRCNVDISAANKAKYCESCRLAICRENGLKSSANAPKRSENEIYFAQLCQAHFEKITTNDPFFESKQGEKWDADVIIHDYKIAVLWNGRFHLKKLFEKHSLAQVQTRDKIKIAVIKMNGYIPYVIEDWGNKRRKQSRKFVEEQFELLKTFIANLGSNF